MFSSCLKNKKYATVTISTRFTEEKKSALGRCVGKQRRQGMPQHQGENHGKYKLLGFFTCTLFFFSLHYTVWSTSSYSQEMEAPGKQAKAWSFLRNFLISVRSQAV